MKNKYIIAVALAAIMVLSVAFLPGALAGKDNKGNGAPNGAHYNLNLIGVKNTDQLKNDDASNGHRIFVSLGAKDVPKRSKIYLYEAGPGESFAVLDGDATDGRGEFQLPPPKTVLDGNGDVVSSDYTVWIRPLGKPGGKADLATCGYHIIDGEEVYECNVGELVVELERTKGKKQFEDVTKELTTVTYCTDYVGGECTTWDTVNIFDPFFDGYLWQYDNQGLKIVQLRFYPSS